MAKLEEWLSEETSISQRNDSERQVYVYDWLCRLEEHLCSNDLNKAELKQCKSKITAILNKQVSGNSSPATRRQLSRCFAIVFSVGDTTGLFECVNSCGDIVKSRDDSSQQLPAKLAAISCIGALFEKLGRMVSPLFIETKQILVKALKSVEAQTKCEVLLCFQKIIFGLGDAAWNGFKDIYKACKTLLVDKSMAVRCAAANCALELSRHAQFMYTTELDSLASTVFRALDGSNYDVRVCLAELLGLVMAKSQIGSVDSKVRKIPLDEMFNIMSSGFLRGSTGFGGELLKGSINREVRVGVTQAYAVLFKELRTPWIERHLSRVIVHILELVASPRSTQTHVDAVYSIKCVSFILHSVTSGMLPESSQIIAVKELCRIITKQMNLVHELVTGESTSDNSNNLDAMNTQYVLVCALHELGNLVLELSSSVSNLMSGVVIDAVLSALIHLAPAAWLSAAWCVRSFTVALPALLTPLIDKCLEKMKSMKLSVEATTGYGYTLAAIIGGLYQCPLGMPHKKTQALFNMCDELLQSSSQTTRLALNRVKTGWVLLGSLMTLGPSFAKESLPRIMQLWSAAFPFATKELSVEKSKGTTKTWHADFENRAGALCAMASFVRNCNELLTADVMKKLLGPLETALASLTELPAILKQHGSQLKPYAAMMKLRLYQLLAILPPKIFESFFTPLLREIVAELTLADHRGATTTSLLQSMCHKDDSILLGSWLQETDHKLVEEQLQTNSASGCGALEHDASCIYQKCPKGADIPGPLPLGVAVIDASVQLFGVIFPFVATKHRAQVLDHFINCINKNKSTRQQAIQTNVFTAFLSALKHLSEQKRPSGGETLRKAADLLLQDALNSPEPTLRCAAGEALGRMAQVLDGTDFVAAMAQMSFEKAKTARDVTTRTGHSLALGCLHRYVGGMGSGHHLSNSVAILFALAKDDTSPIVQVWAIHGLAMIADSGGPMFRSFVEPAITLVVELILRTPTSVTEVHQCLGKCLGALITTVGPELQDNSKRANTLRLSCMTACTIMQHHSDSLVQSEAISCLQQLHIFAPNFVNLSTLVPKLCLTLQNPHLLLRRSSVACLRQLSQREAKEVCEHGMSVGDQQLLNRSRLFFENKGLEGLLFSLFDSEVDNRLRADIRETLVSLLQTLVSENVNHWLSLCKQVLLASKSEDLQTKPQQTNDKDDDDDEEGGLALKVKPVERPTVTPKWTTRVFAMECIRMIITACKENKAHIDLVLARSLSHSSSSRDYLVMQLVELVRMVFIAGTSNNDLLKQEGMKALHDVVKIYAKIPDPDIQDHVILEQFQAQVGAALRPAFNPSTPPDITAMACEVCSAWIGSEISQDINDVRRIQQLLVSSLTTISSVEGKENAIYSESSYTMETLAVLKAWAQIYVMAMKREADEVNVNSYESNLTSGSLLELVESDLKLLAKYWISALRDHAVLLLPSDGATQMPIDLGTFFSHDSVDFVRDHYRKAWPLIAHAVAYWLNTVGFADPNKTMVGASDEHITGIDADSMLNSFKTEQQVNNDRFILIASVCVEALCSTLSIYGQNDIDTCLHALHALFGSPWARKQIITAKALAIELVLVLHRVLLTRDEIATQEIALKVVSQISKGATEYVMEDSSSGHSHGDGDKNSRLEQDVTHGNSVVFALLEVCLVVVSRYTPENIIALKPRVMTGRKKLTSHETSHDVPRLLALLSGVLGSVTHVCSTSAQLEILPTVLYMLVGIFQKCCQINAEQESVVQKSCSKDPTMQLILQSIKSTISIDNEDDESFKQSKIELLRSAYVAVLDFSEEFSKQQISEDILFVASVFILTGGVDVASPKPIRERYLKLFSKVLQSGAPELRLKCVKIISNIIQTSDEQLSFAFIHTCVPPIVEIIQSASTIPPKSDIELCLCKECIALIEILVSLTAEINRIRMVSLIVPCLIQLLLDRTTLPNATKYARGLHQHCIDQLTLIGPRYPSAFKAVMTQSPDMKIRLAEAIRANQATNAKETVRKSDTQAQPKIQLKMDFSNFK